MTKITRHTNTDGTVTIYADGRKAWRGPASEAAMAEKNVGKGALTPPAPAHSTSSAALLQRQGTKITNIDKTAMIMLRDRINAALRELGDELGLELRAGNGTFGGAEGHFKLEMKVDDPSVQEAKQRETFTRFCHSFGLLPSDFGVEFMAGRKRYKLLGLELKRSKYPIRVRDIFENKVVLLTEMVVPAIVASRAK